MNTLNMSESGGAFSDAQGSEERIQNITHCLKE